MTTVSVIIPTFNRKDLLSSTLTCLIAQEPVDGVTLETIVVDDGSTDGTVDVVKDYHDKMSSLKYVFRARDELSSRARARNLGIENSTGEILVFLDCGVLIPPNFIRNVVTDMGSDPRCKVLIHRVAGLFQSTNAGDVGWEPPERLEGVINDLLNTDDWGDPRDPILMSVGRDISLLTAPWALAWTAALTVGKDLCVGVGGFDDSFLGWGAEDTEFAYRLYRGGGLFSVGSAVALHLPHGADEEPDEKALSNAANVRKMHVKHQHFDTEVFSVFTSPHVGRTLQRFTTAYSLTWYQTTTLADTIEARYLSKAKYSVVLGSDNIRFLQRLTASHIFWVNGLGCNLLRETFPNKTVEHRLGVATNYPDRFFRYALVTDFYRWYGTRTLRPLLAELTRISKEVIFIVTREMRPPASGECLVSETELKELAKELGIGCHEVQIVMDHKIFIISKDDSA